MFLGVVNDADGVRDKILREPFAKAEEDERSEPKDASTILEDVVGGRVADLGVAVMLGCGAEDRA